MTGGGKQKGSTSDTSRKYISTTVCREIKKQEGPAANCFRKLAGKLSLHSANQGSILIEFAVCMPVLIILLYYINDLSKLKRYYDQTEFVAQQMVNIIQNISQKRTNKKITATDLKYATAMAYQTISPGMAMFSGNNGPLLFTSHPMIYYVEGNNDGTATTVWRQTIWTGNSHTVSPSTIRHETYTYTHDVSAINMGTNLQPSQIYPTLKIKPGEVKIIVETLLFYETSQKAPREVFGCLLASPKRRQNGTSQKRGGYFNSVVIFTPKSGLFDETPPQ